MISTAILVASCAFGAGAFGFLVGLIASSEKSSRPEVIPLTHVSFDPDMSALEKLRFLDLAAQLVRANASGKPYKLGDDSTSNDKE
ncbi:hypothetical protein F0170_07190 [Pseudomonas sp. MAFF 730085]|uniref:Uncharacterized protein n=1 Tax=Pseudomonas kitaguniensis TaxID=2607908 RepID=A0A5N7JQV4_9PSED|nr:hypothetical protein [Pseudomonas kitaguniensis]MPQ83784.1 hypothetical protein [Pseudomonas kitaguniensis]